MRKQAAAWMLIIALAITACGSSTEDGEAEQPDETTVVTEAPDASNAPSSSVVDE